MDSPGMTSSFNQRDNSVGEFEASEIGITSQGDKKKKKKYFWRYRTLKPTRIRDR